MPFLLKNFQQRTVDTMESFFQALDKSKADFDEIPVKFREKVGDYSIDAWNVLFPSGHANALYNWRKTGHGKYCPNFCIKLPTGGGKTLMATYAIELFLKYLRKKPTGLVLWVVPSEQIFSQTMGALKDRSHPYRQKIDDITHGQVKIITKKDNFSPVDVKDGLVVMLLMLQSFSINELKKDDRKFFQDDGRFPDFFPTESDNKKQRELFDAFPNLDLLQGFDSLLSGCAKTSLGNVVKILEPLIILDEGHKAESELALSAINACNPACVVELTATPSDESNVLMSVSGRELEEEGMIKLDLNLIEEEVQDWKRLLDYSIKHLNELQRQADEYKALTGVYIRPINLIQVEKTGKDQRNSDEIHAEDVKDYLIESGIPVEQIAIKTSTTNDIEGEDLLSSSSSKRFIITKQALQEGWDCSFAYVLTVLSASHSPRALTQLVGRVLRQPFARKTGNKLLDESYVFCLRDSSRKLISVIQKGFENDGLSDLFDRVKSNKTDTVDLGERKKQTVRTPEFQRSLNDFFLPIFVIKDSTGKVREVDFAYDILPYIKYNEIDLSSLEGVHLDTKKHSTQTVTAFNFSQTVAVDREEFLEITEKEQKRLSEIEFRKSFFVRNILDLVPNPWIGQQVITKSIVVLKKRFTEEQIAENQILFLDEIRKILGGDNVRLGEINRLAKEVFLTKLDSDEIRFVLRFNADQILKKESYYEAQGRESFKKSLYEPIVRGSMNDFECEFAHYVEDKKDRTYWWYRNEPKTGYRLIGWRKGKFYPDFIFTVPSSKNDEFEKIFVVETKGTQLARTEDTKYKEELVKLYNEFSEKLKDPWSLQVEGLARKPKKVQFELITQSDWQSELNRIYL